MAEVARDFYERRLTDNRGMILCPHYPISTVNAEVPPVLAEALEAVHCKDVIQEGGEMFSSRGSNDRDKGQPEVTSGLDEAISGDKLSEVSLSILSAKHYSATQLPILVVCVIRKLCFLGLILSCEGSLSPEVISRGYAPEVIPRGYPQRSSFSRNNILQ